MLPKVNLKCLWECPDEDGILRGKTNVEGVSEGVIGIIMEVPKETGTGETFQNEQVDEEERTRNRSEWAPDLGRQAEGPG